MFYFFFNKSFIGTTLMIVLFGFFLFYIDSVAESIISYLLGYNFYYVDQPFIKLIYLLLLVVSIGVLSGLFRSDKPTENDKTTTASGYILSMIVATLIGFALHLYFVYKAMINDGSLLEMEQNYLTYFITDYFLVLGFIIGGLKVRARMM